jgi:hypothetical protein
MQMETKAQKGDIPQKYKDALQNILDQMESETDSMYQFTVNKFGNPSNYNYVIGEFKNRPLKIEIYNMNAEYSELEGIYNSRNEILEKIQSLQCADRFEELKDWTDQHGTTHKLGKCKYCHSYNENIPNRSPNYSTSDYCQNDLCPHRRLNSRWENFCLSAHDSSIYTHGGGSLSICHTKGHYRFVK